MFRCRTVANQSRFAGNGNAVARTVGQISFIAAALFVFTARNTFRVFRSTVFATVAGATVGIIHARIRSAARTVRETALRAWIAARSVVRAGDAFAGVRSVERIARVTRQRRFTITAAFAVGNGVAGASAFVAAGVVFQTVFARTVVVKVLPCRATFIRGANAFARIVDDFFAVAVAFCADGAGFTFSVKALFTRFARPFRAFAGVIVVFGFAIWCFARTRR